MDKYRVMIGADGDDYIYASGLTKEKADKVLTDLKTYNNAYKYIELDTCEADKKVN